MRNIRNATGRVEFAKCSRIPRAVQRIRPPPPISIYMIQQTARIKRRKPRKLVSRSRVEPQHAVLLGNENPKTCSLGSPRHVGEIGERKLCRSPRLDCSHPTKVHTNHQVLPFTPSFGRILRSDGGFGGLQTIKTPIRFECAYIASK